MKQEILERLLMDRALGGLPPDIAALVDAYVEKDPAQRPFRESVNDCVRLAARAFPKPGAAELPPLKLAPMPGSNPVWADRRAGWRILEMAAAFVLGIGLTWWAIHRGPTTTREPQADQLAAAHPPVAPGSPSAFWSLNRLANYSTSPQHASPRRVTWEILMHNTQPMN